MDATILNSEITAAQARGGLIPCRSQPPAIAAAWAEHPEDDERAGILAALLCAPCPVIQQCREFGLSHPTEIGTYGGMSHKQRQPRRGRPRKEIAS